MDLYIERIKPLFDASDVTDKEIEEALHFPRGAIYKWGTGKYKSYKRFIPEIAKYFNVSADYLMGLDDQPEGIKKERPAEGGTLGGAKQKLLDSVDGMSDEQLEKLLGLIEEAKKLL